MTDDCCCVSSYILCPQGESYMQGSVLLWILHVFLYMYVCIYFTYMQA